MNSLEVSKICNCTPQNIRKQTKQAVKQNKAYIQVKNLIFAFRLTQNHTGKAYEYIQMNILSEISPADASALVDSESVKASTGGTTGGVGSLNFTQGENYVSDSCHRNGRQGYQGRAGASCSQHAGSCDAFRGWADTGVADGVISTDDDLVAGAQKNRKGALNGNNAMDARNSVDIWGGNGSVFGLGLANTGVGRDQEQTQINSNERTNDGHEHRDIGADVYDTCAGSETNRSPLPLWQINEQGEASAYIKAHAGDGLHQCEGNPVYQLRFQARSESQRGANGIVIKDEAIECEVVESGGLNLGGISAANLPATLCLPQTKTDAQIRVELSKTKKGLEAQQKEMILKEYARAKSKGVKVVQFIEYINNHRMYSVNLTQNKLFAWQRVYEAEGIEGLVDGRTSHKENQIEAYGLEDKFIELIFASNKRIDAAAICQKLNEYLAVKDALDVDLLANTYAKRKTPITVSAVRRRIKKWQNDNPLADVVRRHGVDKARGMKQPAIGDMNWNITSINQVVEIDATSLDMICINTTLAKMLGMSEDDAKKLQKRFCIISIIDVYSHVRVYQMCESENSLAVQRCLAKYILRYGKPAVIRGDNGKAFLSGAVQSAVIELGIEYHAVTPYSGWKKPFVERNFGVLQSNFTAALAGYIGSCVAERVGLEGLYGKADKKAKKGEKTRLENLMSLEEVTALLDMYAEGTINNTAFGKDKKLPRELYDEKVEEAVYMHEYEVMALIGGIKTVKGGNKKGIQYLGDTYVFSGLFRYSQISFSINLNNTSQLFVFNENRDFIGMAVNNKEGVTKEQAKAEVKLFEKELREAQKRVEKARVAMSKDKVGVIKVSYEHLPRAKYPMPRAANNAVGEMIKTQAEKAANLMRNGQISDAMLQNAAKPKKKKRSGGYVENMMRKRA